MGGALLCRGGRPPGQDSCSPGAQQQGANRQKGRSHSCSGRLTRLSTHTVSTPLTILSPCNFCWLASAPLNLQMLLGRLLYSPNDQSECLQLCPYLICSFCNIWHHGPLLHSGNHFFYGNLCDNFFPYSLLFPWMLPLVSFTEFSSSACTE